MKVLAVFSLVLAVATSYPVVNTWTLTLLSNAIETKANPAMLPYLEDALNQIMYALFTGTNEKFSQAVVPSPTGGAAWTVEQLKAALADPSTEPGYRPALLQAISFVQTKNETGNVQDTVEVAIPALDISSWTPQDLIAALRSPTTKSALIPYLEKANTELKMALGKGETRKIQYMVTPVGLIPPKADHYYLPKPLKNLIKKTKIRLPVARGQFL